MKMHSYVLSMAALSTLAWNCAWAEVVTVNLTARVTWLQDPLDALGGQAAVGEVFTGRYVYDTNAEQQPDAPNVGKYLQRGWQAKARLSSGSLVFESDTPVAYAETRVVANDPNQGWDQLNLIYYGNRPLGNGATVNSIDFMLRDQTGMTPFTTTLPTTAPELASLDQKEIWVSGSLNSTYYLLQLQIESVELVQVQVFDISPGASEFLPQQRFDAALLLPEGSAVASAQASAHGVALPLSYPGTCALAPPNSTGRPSIICLDAHTALATAPTATQVEWQVEMVDGTVLNKTVEWKLIQ